MDNRTTTTRWNICLLLLSPFYLSTCGENGSSADTATGQPPTSTKLIETDKAGNVPASRATLDGSENTPEKPKHSDTSPPAWGSARLIASDDARDVFWPQVTLDNNDNALAVWKQYGGVHKNIRASHFEHARFFMNNLLN